MDEIGSSSNLRLSGIATGLDTSALISAMLQLERRPLDLVEDRRADLERQQSLFRDLNKLVLELRDAARALDNRNDGLSGGTLDEELLAYQATSSDPTRLTASAGGNASAGVTDVRVLELAQVGRRVSVALPSDTEAIDPLQQTGTVNLQIAHGGAQDIAFSFDTGTTSLADLRNLINSDPDNQGHVRAELLFDGAGHRLVISGTETGEDNDVDVTSGLPGLIDADLTQQASDARIELLGIEVTRPDNEIDDVLPGVTLQLRATTDANDPTDTVQVEVQRDDEAIAEKLEALATAYNKIRDFATAQSAFDEKAGRAGPLSGDAALRGIERQLQRVLGARYELPDNPLTFLGEIGLSFDRNGRLVLDREGLRAALDEDVLQVRQLLSGDGDSDGAATALARALEPIVSGRLDEAGQWQAGTLALRDQALGERMEGLDLQIARFEQRLAKREELLVQTFSRLESVIARLQSQQSFLSSAF